MASRDALDALLGDMAGHQVEHNHEIPTPAKNQAMAAELLEVLDRKASEPAPPPMVLDTPGPESPRPSDMEAEKRGFKILRGEELGKERHVKLGPKTLERYEKMRSRIKLLMTKRERGPLGQPSWAERVGDVLADHYDPKCGRTLQERKAHAAKRMATLVEESNAVFGPWWADPPKKVIVG
jgi:hypothetical protein